MKALFVDQSLALKGLLKVFTFIKFKHKQTQPPNPKAFPLLATLDNPLLPASVLPQNNPDPESLFPSTASTPPM